MSKKQKMDKCDYIKKEIENYLKDFPNSGWLDDCGYSQEEQKHLEKLGKQVIEKLIWTTRGFPIWIDSHSEEKKATQGFPTNNNSNGNASKETESLTASLKRWQEEQKCPKCLKEKQKKEEEEENDEKEKEWTKRYGRHF